MLFCPFPEDRSIAEGVRREVEKLKERLQQAEKVQELADMLKESHRQVQNRKQNAPPFLQLDCNHTYQLLHFTYLCSMTDFTTDSVNALYGRHDIKRDRLVVSVLIWCSEILFQIFVA